MPRFHLLSEMVSRLWKHSTTTPPPRWLTPYPQCMLFDRVWLSIYFASVSVMLIAAVFALAMRSICRAPMVLGFVSSLTRDSTYFEDPHENSTEGGAQRVKRLGSIRAMVNMNSFTFNALYQHRRLATSALKVPSASEPSGDPRVHNYVARPFVICRLATNS